MTPGTGSPAPPQHSGSAARHRYEVSGLCKVLPNWLIKTQRIYSRWWDGLVTSPVTQCGVTCGVSGGWDPGTDRLSKYVRVGRTRVVLWYRQDPALGESQN